MGSESTITEKPQEKTLTEELKELSEGENINLRELNYVISLMKKARSKVGKVAIFTNQTDDEISIGWRLKHFVREPKIIITAGIDPNSQKEIESLKTLEDKNPLKDYRLYIHPRGYHAIFPAKKALEGENPNNEIMLKTKCSKQELEKIIKSVIDEVPPNWIFDERRQKEDYIPPRYRVLPPAKTPKPTKASA